MPGLSHSIAPMKHGPGRSLRPVLRAATARWNWGAGARWQLLTGRISRRSALNLSPGITSTPASTNAGWRMISSGHWRQPWCLTVPLMDAAVAVSVVRILATTWLFPLLRGSNPGGDPGAAQRSCLSASDSFRQDRIDGPAQPSGSCADAGACSAAQRSADQLHRRLSSVAKDSDRAGSASWGERPWRMDGSGVQPTAGSRSPASRHCSHLFPTDMHLLQVERCRSTVQSVPGDSRRLSGPLICCRGWPGSRTGLVRCCCGDQCMRKR